MGDYQIQIPMRNFSDSSLGMQMQMIWDFLRGTNAKFANLLKNPKNIHSHTANTRIVLESSTDNSPSLVDGEHFTKDSSNRAIANADSGDYPRGRILDETSRLCETSEDSKNLAIAHANSKICDEFLRFCKRANEAYIDIRRSEASEAILKKSRKAEFA